MKIAIVGAPSTGKSVFARTLAAEITRRGVSCELIPEYASRYIQQVGPPEQPWEELVMSFGKYLAEEASTRALVVTEDAPFTAYLYGQRLLPKIVSKSQWHRFRHALELLRTLARRSVDTYQLIFLLTHVYPPWPDGVRLPQHQSVTVCRAINRELRSYLTAERAPFVTLDTTATDCLASALKQIASHAPPDIVRHLKVRAPTST